MQLNEAFNNAGSNACAVGFIAAKDGQPSHDVVRIALHGKAKTFHRVGYAADGKTTDGDGIETEVPESFFNPIYEDLGGKLDEGQRLAVGQLFLPRDKTKKEEAWRIIEEEMRKSGLKDFKRRDVKPNLKVLGPIARKTMPDTAQIIFPVSSHEEDKLNTEILLERTHQRIHERFVVAGLIGPEPETCHIASFSADRIIYKARSDPKDEGAVWPDLQYPDYQSRWAKIHGRFTTAGSTRIENIQPLPGGSAHNGTITTQAGLTNSVTSVHQYSLAAQIGEGGADILPLARPGASDSAFADRVNTAMRLIGRSLARAKMTMFPKGKNRSMDVSDRVLGTRRYLANEMETADGPALFVTNNGTEILAALDANGSRPAVIQETDKYFTLGSEAGMWGFNNKTELTATDKLTAGQMIRINTRTGQVTHDKELEEEVALEDDFEVMNDRIKDIQLDSRKIAEPIWEDEELAWRLRHSGYSKEDIDFMVHGMLTTGTENNGSMGETTISRGAGDHYERGEDFYEWQHNQIVAPAHNADLDGDMMDLSARFAYPVDRHGNFREKIHVIPDRFVLSSPMLEQTQEQIGKENFVTIDCTFDIKTETYEQALDRIGLEAIEAGKQGKNIILTDEFIAPGRMPVYMQHATGEAHTKLNQSGLRGDIGLIVKCGECHTSHGAALLKAMGATVVVPYLVEQKILKMHEDGLLKKKDEDGEWQFLSLEQGFENFFGAINKGIKIAMQRTLTLSANSMQGALKISANGLSKALVSRVHPGVASRKSGIGPEKIQKRMERFHNEIFYPSGLDLKRVFHKDGHARLHVGGRFVSRANGIKHAITSGSIYALRLALGYENLWKEKEPYSFKEGWRIWKDRYLARARGADNPFYSCDGLRIDTSKCKSIDPDDPKMQSVDELVSETVVVSAMSIGAISLAAHLDIHKAANDLDFESNTGEGGYPQELLDNPDFMPKVAQWSTNAYGIRPELLTKAEVIEFKFAQGAKSGEGGNMPGSKVKAMLAKLRFILTGKEQQSSPLHMDMRSIEDLKQKIKLALRVNPNAEIRIKIVAEEECEDHALGAVKAMKNAMEELNAVGYKTSGKMSIHLSGRRGGTASAKPLSIWGSGSDWEPHLPRIHKTLTENGFRDQVKLIVDGGMMHGEDMAKALVLGADKVGFGTFIMQTIGCLLQKQCQTGECITDIAVVKILGEFEKYVDVDGNVDRDGLLEALEHYQGDSEYIKRAVRFLGKDLQSWMAKVGVTNTDELKGRTDLLKHTDFALDNDWDYSEALADGYSPKPGSHYRVPKISVVKNTINLGKNFLSEVFAPLARLIPSFRKSNRSIDLKIIKNNPNLIRDGGVFNIKTDNRCDGVGVTISGLAADYLLKKTKSLNEGVLKTFLPDDHILFKAEGTLGYGSGALLAQGVSVELDGIAGDSFGANIRAGIAAIKYPADSLIGRDPDKSVVLAQKLAGGFITGGEVHIPGLFAEDAAFQQSGGLIVTRGGGKAGQSKRQGTFIAWKDGVDIGGSFSNHAGGESFMRTEGVKAGDLVKAFSKSQPKVHFETLQDPEAKMRLRRHLLRSFERTADPALYEFLQKRNWDKIAGEFMHVRTFQDKKENGEVKSVAHVPDHYYQLPAGIDPLGLVT
ncbi:MAG: glutamate synthase-related protein [Alphaproteobacteria bacterium]